MSNGNETNDVILVVEDSEEDFYAINRSFSKTGLVSQLKCCRDGEEALNYLYRKDKYIDVNESPRPIIILLDLNLPGVDGREVLQIIKKDENLKKIPVLVLTTSNDPKDIEECYKAGANSYIQKPVSVIGFLEAIQHLKDFWFEVVILPKRNSK